MNNIMKRFMCGVLLINSFFGATMFAEEKTTEQHQSSSELIEFKESMDPLVSSGSSEESSSQEKSSETEMETAKTDSKSQTSESQEKTKEKKESSTSDSENKSETKEEKKNKAADKIVKWNKTIEIEIDGDHAIIKGGTITNPDQLRPVITPKIQEITFSEPLKIIGSAEQMFGQMHNLKKINGFENVDTSEVTNMVGMFAQCFELSEINLAHFNTKNVTDMMGMFYECKAVNHLDLSSFKTTKVQDMQIMFFNCSNLETVNLSSFDTSNVLNMYSMFINCTQLKELDLSNFETSKVEDMCLMFSGCRNLKKLNIENFNTLHSPSDFGIYPDKPITKLSEITLGKNHKFSSAFPRVDLSSKEHTGNWINVGEGTVLEPKGNNIWTSKELGQNYIGQHHADTYVWEKVATTETEDTDDSDSSDGSEAPGGSDSEDSSEEPGNSDGESSSETPDSSDDSDSEGSKDGSSDKDSKSSEKAEGSLTDNKNDQTSDTRKGSEDSDSKTPFKFQDLVRKHAEEFDNRYKQKLLTFLDDNPSDTKTEAKKESKFAKWLPQTGEQRNFVLSVIGFLIIVVVGTLGYKSYVKRKK